MVDSGNSKNHVEAFNEAVRNEGLRTPEFIAITHWHWDHTFGMHAVKGTTIANRSRGHYCRITSYSLTA